MMVTIFDVILLAALVVLAIAILCGKPIRINITHKNDSHTEYLDITPPEPKPEPPPADPKAEEKLHEAQMEMPRFDPIEKMQEFLNGGLGNGTDTQ